jgi:glycosyltransferase involved in cell wall biosynthesis
MRRQPANASAIEQVPADPVRDCRPPTSKVSESLFVSKPPEEELPPRIAVAIPCYNEAPAIGTVIAQFRAALPGAEVVVFDNNSTDGTAEAARGSGVRVEPVPAQGKGYVVREAFARLGDRDALILVDGDGTYPAEAAPLLVAPVLDGTADMVVGARQPEPGAGAMSPVRGLGNLLIRSAFRILIGPGTGDLLSGYRAFSPKFLRAVELRSEGFEIETELAIAAVTHRLRALEVSVPYRPRIAGTVSKLNAFRDGRRILRTILIQGLRRDRARVILVYCGLVSVLFLPFLGGPTWVNGVWLFLLAAGFLGLTTWAALIHRKPSRASRPAEVEKR